MGVIATRIAVRAILDPDAFVAGPGQDQRTARAEVLPREHAMAMGNLRPLVEHIGERFVSDLPIPIIAEDRVIPRGAFNRQAGEPAKQQISGNLLDQLSITAHAVGHLQQHRSDELLGGDAKAPAIDIGAIHSRELGNDICLRCVNSDTDWAKRVARTHELLDSYRAEQRFAETIGPSHRGLDHCFSNQPCSRASTGVSTKNSTGRLAKEPFKST